MCQLCRPAVPLSTTEVGLCTKSRRVNSWSVPDSLRWDRAVGAGGSLFVARPWVKTPRRRWGDTVPVQCATRRAAARLQHGERRRGVTTKQGLSRRVLDAGRGADGPSSRRQAASKRVVLGKRVKTPCLARFSKGRQTRPAAERSAAAAGHTGRRTWLRAPAQPRAGGFAAQGGERSAHVSVADLGTGSLAEAITCIKPLESSATMPTPASPEHSSCGLV